MTSLAHSSALKSYWVATIASVVGSGNNADYCQDGNNESATKVRPMAVEKTLTRQNPPQSFQRGLPYRFPQSQGIRYLCWGTHAAFSTHSWGFGESETSF
jgi:hypothetical protein